MKEHILAACKLLSEIYTDRTYADRVFDGENASALSVRLVFGVLDTKLRLRVWNSRCVQSSFCLLLDPVSFPVINLYGKFIISDFLQNVNMRRRAGVKRRLQCPWLPPSFGRCCVLLDTGPYINGTPYIRSKSEINFVNSGAAILWYIHKITSVILYLLR